MYAASPIRITIKKYNQPIKLIFCGDLHWAAEESMTSLWWRMFRENQEAYFIGTGDWLHMINPNDKRWAGTRLREEFTKADPLSKICQAEIDDLADKMLKKLGKEWMDNHILGGLSGNHPFKKKKDYGFDPWEMFCEKTGIFNLGYSCMLPIIIDVGDSAPLGSRNSKRFIILLHHGFGGAKRTEGGDTTAFTRHAMQYEAEICVYGHTHNKWSKRIPVAGWRGAKTGPVIKEIYTKVVGQAGTFQKTLSEHKDPTWAETMGFPLRDLGWLTVWVSLRRYREGKRQIKWLDINSQE